MEQTQTDRENSEFLLRACHDLRAAARAVRTHSELLLRDAQAPSNGDLESRLGFVVDGARKIDLLLDALAAYAVALQTDSASFQPTPTGVLLRSVMMKLAQPLRDSGAEVTYTELPVVMGNSDRLMQLWESLLRNALVHRGEDAPRIQIAAVAHDEGWLFTVRDNGPGIEAASLETVFRPFTRLNGAQRPGAGLGLAIARAIVERHGGRIWAEPAGDRGAIFHFTLPAA